MGIVYEAIRESLRSRVALKIMHPRFRENAGYLRRFHVEACAAASLHHTNIVSVFDYGETDGVVYYAMPYIAGQSLERVLQDVRRIRGDQSGGLAEILPQKGSRNAVPDAIHAPAKPHRSMSIGETMPEIRSPSGCSRDVSPSSSTRSGAEAAGVPPAGAPSSSNPDQLMP